MCWQSGRHRRTTTGSIIVWKSDFSASQRLSKHAKVFIDMLNLANRPYRVYMGGPNRFIQEERYKIWAIAGFKVDF